MTLRETRARLRRYHKLMAAEPDRFLELRDVVRQKEADHRLNVRRRVLQLEHWHERQTEKNLRRIEEARRIPSAVRREVLESGPCAYCGGYEEAVAIDHVIPIIKGGDRRRRNLAPACYWCNSEKSGCTPEEWRARRLAQGRPWPPLPIADRLWQLWAKVNAALEEQELPVDLATISALAVQMAAKYHPEFLEATEAVAQEHGVDVPRAKRAKRRNARRRDAA